MGGLVFFSLFSISFFFVLYVSKKKRKNEAMQEDVFGFGFGVRRTCSVEMLLVYYSKEVRSQWWEGLWM
jgi:hypothetical protein